MILGAEKVKSMIRKKSEDIKISSQVLLQNYMFEKLLERVAKSEYAERFIIKGGLLVASLVDIQNRSTTDLDALLNGVQFERDEVVDIVKSITEIENGDGIVFEFQGVSEIREGSPYGGFRIKLKAILQTVVVDLSVDLSSGDPITPHPIELQYKKLFDESKIQLKAYSIETVLAEKLHTIFSHGLGATRTKDYYDVYLLAKLYSNSIDFGVLNDAMMKTARFRQGEQVFDNWKARIEEFRGDKILNERWERFQKGNTYVGDAGFNEICEAVEEVMSEVYRHIK